MAEDLRATTHLINIRDLTGRNPDKWVALDDLNTFFSTEEQLELGDLQTAVGTYAGEKDLSTDVALLQEQVGDYNPASTGRTIAEDLTTVYTPIMKQGVRAKMDKISTGTDDMYEVLENKHLVNPLLNDATGVHASYTITLTPVGEATGSITLTVRQIGDVGNDRIVNSSIGFVYNSVPKEIQLDNTSTGQDFLDWYNEGLENGADDLQADIVETHTGDMTLLLPDLAVPSNGMFAGGIDPHVVSSTGAQLDAAVTNRPEAASTPTTAQTYATGRLTFAGATNPTDGDTITVGSKTYTFRDALTVGGLENEILICLTSVPDDTCLAIQYAINATVGQTAFYGTGTTANADVVATAGDNLVDLTCEGSTNAATLLGTAGNAVATTVSAGLTEASFAAAHLTGGLDITAAAAGKIIVGSGGIYVAKAECTASSSNWETISYDV